MGWLASFGAGVITAFATAIVWGWLAYFYTQPLRLERKIFRSGW